MSFTMCPRLHLVCVNPESAASDIRKRLSSIYSVDRGGEQTKQQKQLSGFLPRLSITTPIAVDMTTIQDEKRRRVDVRMLAHHAAARIFNSIDKESSSARSRDGLISFADMIGWLSRNGLIYHLKDESDYPPLPEDVEEPPPPEEEEEEKLTPSQLKWHEILKTHASDGMYFTSKPEPRPQNRRSTLDSVLDTSKYKNSESDLRKAHTHLEIVDEQAREAASKGKRHALKREFEVYVVVFERTWCSRAKRENFNYLSHDCLFFMFISHDCLFFMFISHDIHEKVNFITRISLIYFALEHKRPESSLALRARTQVLTCCGGGNGTYQHITRHS